MGKRKGLNDVLYGDRSDIRKNLGRAVDLGKELDLDLGGSRKGSSKKFDSYGSGESCYHGHKPLKLPGTDLVIYGGSCISPAVTDADVYIGFDSGMKMTARSYPWKQGTEFLFRIRDMAAPDNPAEFTKLVKWVRKQLEDGKKVHVGCIGGHGRTGTFLAALVADFGETDAITYVRQHYCQKVVESTEQVNFLHEHFGVKKIGGSKSHSKSHGKGGSVVRQYHSSTGVDEYGHLIPSAVTSTTGGVLSGAVLSPSSMDKITASRVEHYTPMASRLDIWGDGK